MTIDWNFIASMEGKGITQGYVPKPDTSQSGVTIATGVDLGQMTAASLAALNLDATLTALLTPYLGLQRYDAVKFLATNPLTLTQAQAGELDQAVQSSAAQALETHYNASGGDWDSVPDPAQTVIADVAFQYGTYLEHPTPNFWKQALAQDWQGMYQNLMNFGDSFTDRRHAEAALLQPLVLVA